MGIIRRQSIQNLVFSYGGVILGYLNQIYLALIFLSMTQYGLVNVLLNTSVLFSEFALLGIISAVLRFSTYFKDKSIRSREFNFLILIYPLIGGILLSSIFFLLKDSALSFFAEESPLFVEYYYLIFPIFILMAYSGLINTILNAQYKSVLSIFLKEILLRLCQTAAVALFALELIHFNTLLLLYVGSYVIQLTILIAYLLYLGKFKVTPNTRIFRRPIFRLVTKYGMFAFFAQASASIAGRIDLIMLGSDLAGLDYAAVYAVVMSLSLIIFMPARAVNPIAVPIIAKSWKTRDLDQIQQVYRETALNNLVLGIILFIGIWINLDSLYLIIGKPAYAAGKFAFLFLGMAKLFDVATGVNGGIIYTSKKYQYDLYFNIGLIILVITTNLILIPLYQITGAAIATAISIFLYNLSRTLFVWYAFKMQPFTRKTVMTILIAGSSFLVSTFIPYIGNPFGDILVRSLVTGGMYLSLVYLLNISPQLNGLVQVVQNRINNR